MDDQWGQTSTTVIAVGNQKGGVAKTTNTVHMAAAGVWIDRQAGSSPWGFLIGFALGLAAGILNVFRATRQYTK